METYPRYYRKEGTAMKVVSPTQVKIIILPPERPVAERYSSTYPTAERLKETLTSMQEITEQDWKSFYYTFCQAVEKERQLASGAVGQNGSVGFWCAKYLETGEKCLAKCKECIL